MHVISTFLRIESDGKMSQQPYVMISIVWRNHWVHSVSYSSLTKVSASIFPFDVVSDFCSLIVSLKKIVLASPFIATDADLSTSTIPNAKYSIPYDKENQQFPTEFQGTLDDGCVRQRLVFVSLVLNGHILEVSDIKKYCCARCST